MGEPVQIQILGVGRFAWLNREYYVEYSISSASAISARLSGSAWKREYSMEYSSARLEARRAARHSSSTSGARGCAWSHSAGSSGGACRSPRCPINLMFATVSSYWWALRYGMIKTCFWQLWKFGYLPKHFCFLTNGALIPICWWERPLVVALKHSEGIKHTVLFQETRSLKAYNTHPLSFSCVSLYSLPHNSISSACYLYTNSKQDNSTFKCEGGCGRWCEGGWRLRLVAGGWQLAAAAGRWVVAFLDLLDWV